MSIRVAILTVSDTAAVDSTADRSGPIIKDIIYTSDACEVKTENCLIVPDDVDKIRDVVQGWCDSGIVDWIVTTGGTGFGVRDVTPEAISPLIERPAPGLVHLMLSSSIQHTPFAALSRPVAGTCRNTLITTLPGSIKAVTENIKALFQAGVIIHAIELIQGGSGRRVHASLAAQDTSQGEAQSGSIHRDHHHHHHHDGGHHTPKPRSTVALSHDPSAPPSARHRQSPYPQIPLEKALQIIRETIQRLPAQTLPVNHRLGGHILAEDVYAPQDAPQNATTSVDGYALRSTDLPGIYKVLTSQTHSTSAILPVGSIYRINTGGPLPLGADAVIMVEDTRLVSTFDENSVEGIPGDEKEVETLAQVPPGENVRAPGSDVMKGDLVMRAGERVSRGGGEVGTLTFVGRKEVKVYRKPVVAILSTGNEIVDMHSSVSQPSTNDSWGGVYDTNRPSLRTLLESLGYDVVDLGIVPDDIPAHLAALKKGLQMADLLLTTGGTSMGPTDLLKPLIERYLDGVVHFGRVSVKPGKPTTFATVPVAVKEGPGTPSVAVSKPVFALPGNPASALVTFYVFVIPALRRMGSWPERMCELPRVMVQIQNAMNLDPRTEFHRVVIRSTLTPFSGPNKKSTAEGNRDEVGAVMKAYSTGGQRSSRAASLCQANGLVVLPPLAAPTDVTSEPRRTRLEPGELVQTMIIGEIEVSSELMISE
ncbi:molybdenum cofactor biosynthesis protein [Crassisporium funariophilum]|nr:molybdenum cofactor biosynthesis protein [Crassisporium funariophilum]